MDPDRPIVGRVLTAQYWPNRPELQKRLLEMGHAQGQVGPMNSWPIDMLQQGDVYVADAFGKIKDGTLIGDNLGNAIYAKSGNGVIFNAGVRDWEGLEAIDGFNAFVRGSDPSFLQEVMLGGINVPIRIGGVLVLPGDVVLARKGGILFIPAQFAQEVVETAEVVVLRDTFGIMRLREGTYTPGQIDTEWTDEIKADFFAWLEENVDTLPVPESRVRQILVDRHW
jgi:regulator of RNase E activity RraA